MLRLLWCLKMVVSHDSYNPCNDIPALFSGMFPGCEIALKFLLGKTKGRYTLLYSFFSEFKKTLIYDISKFPFYVICSDESSNSEMQMCQMDVAASCWNENKNIV